ncbi:MAG: bifunctional metallophosphatase/5'-nucleotidase [Ignavibacteriae bacterium]|nr:bifunctional metallophosphatase/5'-nucleotidase [Ignavibacteriota bacterium]
MTKNVTLVSSLILLINLVACAQPKSLTILHTNDIHSNFVSHEAAWVRSEPKPFVGGMNELEYMIDSMRKARTSEVLLLDAGDDMTGNPISEIEHKKAFGGGFIEMMNKLNYDAWTPGNHDLDISQSNLQELIAIAKHPAVSANLVDEEGNFPMNLKPFTIVEKNGVRIGIIGIMTPELFHVTNTNNLKGLKLLSPTEVVQKYIDSLDEQTDLLIALTHQGVDEDSVLAMGTHGLDVIIGGHSHTRLRTPKYINNVIIGQTGSNCENLGVIDLQIENDKVISYNGQLVQLWAHEKLPDTELSNLVNEFKTKIDKEYGIVLGTLDTDWKRSPGETAIGFFVADAIRLGGNADVGIINSSGIRKDMLKGDVTRLDLFEVGPFRNYVCTFSMTGKELRSMIQNHVEKLASKQSSNQFAGVNCSYKKLENGVEIQSISVGGKELDDSETYTCATTDFVINQADKYLGFVPPSNNCTMITMSQAMENKARNEKVLKTPEPQFKLISEF